MTDQAFNRPTLPSLVLKSVVVHTVSDVGAFGGDAFLAGQVSWLSI